MQAFAFDTETWPILPGRKIPRLVCSTWAGQDGESGIEKGCAHVVERLYDDDIHIVGHNVAFDLAVTTEHARETLGVDPLPRIFDLYEAGRIRDTMIHDKLVMIAEGRFRFDRLLNRKPNFQLSDLVSRWRGVDISEDKKSATSWRKRFWMLEDIPLEEWPYEAIRYARDDAFWTLAVHEDLVSYERTQPPEQELQRQIETALNGTLIEAWGMRTHPELTHTTGLALGREYERLVLLNQSHGYRKANGKRDMKVIKDKIEDVLGDLAPRTPTGAIGTANDVLLDTGDESLEILARSLKYERMYKNYLPIMELGVKVPITPRIDTLKITGRTSYSKPPLQQLPRADKRYPEAEHIRGSFIPREGYVYLSADYSTVELRALAQVCLEHVGWSDMALAFKEGKDLHVMLAADIMGISYEEAHRRHKADDEEVKGVRQFAKVGNFGFPGGQGAPSFVKHAWKQRGIKITVAEAKALRRQWMSRWTEMKPYFKWINSHFNGRQFGTVTQLYSGRVRGGAKYTEACNTLFQGLAGDGAKEAMRRLIRACYHDRQSALWGSRVVLFMHDEFILETPIRDYYNAQAQEFQRHMVEGMEVFTPDVKAEAEPAVTTRWIKDAKPSFDLHGNMIITE